jgi:hypothetical protein
MLSLKKKIEWEAGYAGAFLKTDGIRRSLTIMEGFSVNYEF